MSAVPLGSLFRFIRNGLSVKQDKSGLGLPITRIETISDAVVDPTRVGFAGLREADARDWLLEPGDILFSHINSVQHIGKCAIYRGQPEKLVHGMNLLCLRSDETKLHPEFAKYLLRSGQFRARLSNCIKKAVNQASVSIGDIQRIPVVVPPLSEQRRIAEILDKTDALRAKRRAALAQLDTLTQSTFLDMFGDPATNPKGWPVSRVGAVAKQIRGVTYSKGEASKEPKAGYLPILRAGNISAGDILMDDLVFVPGERVAGEQLLRRNDVLIAASSGSLDVVGKAARVRDDMQVGFGAFCKVLRPGSDVDPFFFAAFFSTRHYRLRISELAAGININNLRNEHLDNFPLPKPPSELQSSFAEMAVAIACCRESQRGSLSALDSLFASLQHRAFRGEL